MRRYILLLLAAALSRLFSGICYGDAQPSAPTASMPEFEHVFVLVEENESYDDVVGNTDDMPFLNSLMRRYGLATNYYANSHPSVNDYFFLTAGQSEFSGFWSADGMLADRHSGTVSGENIASILTNFQKTWKAYLEGLPKPGSLTPSHHGYVKRHDPFAYFRTVVSGTRDRPPQRANLVPFEPDFERDLLNHAFPSYSFIVPDIYDDGHTDAKSHKEASCGDHPVLKRVDQWLTRNIGPLVEDADFQRSGLLIIVFDEACSRGSKADNRLDPKQPSIRGGGHLPAIIISSKTRPATISDRLLHHQSILRLCLRALGIQQFPGAAATAPDMYEFFTALTAENHR